jgi:glycosyltransferase involved in cell wall biosynthesis
VKKPDKSIQYINKTSQLNSGQVPTIGFLTTDWAWGTEPLQPNGCAWYRCVLPGVELEKRNWICGVGIPAFNERDGFGMVTGNGKAVHGWDIIVFKLIMHKDALTNLARAQELGQKIVVDVDDFFDGLEPTNRAYEATDPEQYPDNNRAIYAEIIRRSFAIITSTQFLYDYYSKIHKNVFLVRNSIDEDRYLRIRKVRRNHTKTKIGWVGATPWRSGDLEELSEFIGNYIKLKNIRFHHSGHVGGSASAAEQLQIEQHLVSTSNLCPISDYPRMFEQIDIGIVPLKDVPFNHAKSFIKGLEYAAAGVPFIASDLPEYRYLFEAGIGRIANTEQDWIYHFEELLDKQLRDDEAKINRDLLSEFSIKKRVSDWESVMMEILEQDI